MEKQNQIKKDIVSWSRNFPVDRWWREKHKIPFMSAAHREISFLDQLFEYYEDEMYESIKNEDRYEPNRGEFISENDSKSKIERAREEFEREFLKDGR
jgi:hypothetical protein